MTCPHCHGEARHGKHGAGTCAAGTMTDLQFTCIRCRKKKPASGFYVRFRAGALKPTGACRSCKRIEYDAGKAARATTSEARQ